MTRQDRALNVVFGQIELMETLAIAGGDPTLAAELRGTLNMALERYCERQRAKLEAEFIGGSAQAA